MMIILDKNNNEWFVNQTRYDFGTTITVIDHYGTIYETQHLTSNKADSIEKDIIGLNRAICWAELAFIFVRNKTTFFKVNGWKKSTI